MATTHSILTAEQLLEAHDLGRCELVRGELIMMSPGGFRHGRIVMSIGAQLYEFVRDNALGVVMTADTGFHIARDPDTVRAPDVMFVSNERLPDGVPEGFLPIPPDLAVEIVSPTDKFSDITAKAEEYAAAGVRMVWVVDPQTRRAYVFRPGQAVRSLVETQSLPGEEVLPGFELPLKELFRK